MQDPDKNAAGAEDSLDLLREREDVDQRYIVPGLSRGLGVLALFGQQRTKMTLSEIAATSNLSRSAAYRLVYTLEKEGFLSREAGTRSYRVTSKVMSLGFAYLSTMPLVEIVYPHLRRISEKTGAASHLVGLDDVWTVYLARITPHARLVSNLQVGTRLPAHASVSGRVLLAGQSDGALESLYERLADVEEMPSLSRKELVERAREDRRRGYVMADSIFETSILSFAAPVRDARGSVVAALNVLGPKKLLEAVGDAEALFAIVGTEAQELSASIGYSG